jgi:hypothetical protein
MKIYKILSIAVFVGLSVVSVCAQKEKPLVVFDALLDAYFPVDHFLPRASVRKLLHRYSDAEIDLIYADYIQLNNMLFAGATKNNEYVATAGAPTAGKSTVLEAYMAQSTVKYVYADPDRSCLLNMMHTYKKDIADKKYTHDQAYQYWRDASNFLAYLFLSKALSEGYAIAHGTTSTSATVSEMFRQVRTKYSRTIRLLHVTCDQAVREASENVRRASGVVQCTWEDFNNKIVTFCTLLPLYLSLDQVDFYWRDSLVNNACHAAKVNGGSVQVINQKAFDAIKELHDGYKQQGYAGSCFKQYSYTHDVKKLITTEEQEAHDILQKKYESLERLWGEDIFAKPQFFKSYHKESLVLEKPIIFISLGSNCSAAIQFKHRELSEAFFPFDFVRSDDFKSIHQALSTEFKDFLTFQNLFITSKKTGHNIKVLDKEYGITFVHDFMEDSLLSNYEQVRAKYYRRIDRFYHALTLGRPVVFFRTLITKKDALSLNKLIRNQYPNLNYTLVVIDGSEDFKKDWGIKNIKNIFLKNAQIRFPIGPLWKNENWDNIFSILKKTCNFA